ncbi:MAG: Cof-type HAD-IIB family hydrolase [Muribaculaceae bacterium]|nr:Cof-type HAD-IIB family hydrolase [Muribaculaceae bacterium]
MRHDTLYISDMDGTLLGTDSRVSERSAAIISDLSRRGALITVATARTPATVVPLLAGITTNAPAIVMTGCALWDRRKDRFDLPHFLPADDVLKAMDICLRHGVHPFVYVMAPDGASLDVYHSGVGLNKAEESFYLERAKLKLKRFHLGTPAPARALEAGMLLFAMGPRATVEAAAASFAESTDCSVCCYPDIFNPEVYNFEIFPPGVTKASAVRRLGEQLGARRLVVFGDSLNDLSMFAVADVAVAMGNALPEVKEAADVVIEPNYTDAVARFIESDFCEI